MVVSSTVSLYGSRLPPDHPTALIFLDETGVVQKRDPFFGIGLLKVRDPAALLRGVQIIRDRLEFHEEIHWASLDKAGRRGRDRRLQVALEVMDLVFDTADARFCCQIADRQHGDLTAKFSGQEHADEMAYEWLASRVIREVIEPDEIVSVIADKRSTSPKVKFEAAVAQSINQAEDRLAVASVCRVDSRSTDGLQLVDLLLGAAALDLRQGRTTTGSQKQQLLAHLLERCDCPTFRPHGRSDPAGKWGVTLLSPSRKTRRKRRGGKR
jgi:hypothetical protein